MSERIKPIVLQQHVEFLQRCLDGNLPDLNTLHEICVEISYLRGDVNVKWQQRAIVAEQKLQHALVEIERLKATIRHYDSADPDIEERIRRDGGPGCGKYDC